MPYKEIEGDLLIIPKTMVSADKGNIFLFQSFWFSLVVLEERGATFIPSKRWSSGEKNGLPWKTRQATYQLATFVGREVQRSAFWRPFFWCPFFVGWMKSDVFVHGLGDDKWCINVGASCGNGFRLATCCVLGSFVRGSTNRDEMAKLFQADMLPLKACR